MLERSKVQGLGMTSLRTRRIVGKANEKGLKILESWRR
ncbi:MAG: hypothetical protein CM1200mP12_17180 [Gammaproteobacteria bacterium]|nr:MAG: hypothetical protein CM1200mP12_17180 [Gammaproteobacteria bacterium]